ncbi:unnamed protein product [Adineta ricciae]|uniref:Uncharacterized protein n=1 Tax=Adineta ricciae TaxID=249248 RepID=A0A815JX15_ADIRI|nr:unnamed protein product [Adineta ricciae]CAF1443675.1 unnamed protein product [Adineta ricciae]
MISKLAEMLSEVGNQELNLPKIQYAEKQMETAANPSRLEPLNAKDLSRAPLTSAQKQIWFFWKLKPHSSIYNVPIASKING